MAKHPTRRDVLQWTGGLAAAACTAPWTAVVGTARAAGRKPRLRAASLEFAIHVKEGGPTAYTGRYTDAKVRKVAGPLKGTVNLFEDGALRVCVVTADFNTMLSADVSAALRGAVADILDVPAANVLLFSSHNHSDTALTTGKVETYLPVKDVPEPAWLPVGRELRDQLCACARRLPEMLQPVSVWWAQGSEGRITYNRKGRRADGSTYFMREEDRDLVGADFNGDIDRETPIVLLKNEQGATVAALAQFTGHPVTCYHPERPVVFGDWPRVACDLVAKHLDAAGAVPVGFLQGCAGDVNSKGMLRSTEDDSIRYGRMLAESYIKALADLKPSGRDGMHYAVEKVGVPLAPLPPAETLRAEIVEMEDFIRRASAGDERTRQCVGLNFPRALSPAYRAKLVEAILPWSRWALELHQGGRAGTVARTLDVEIYVLRLGDVGIVGMPFESFQGIGRQIRRRAPLPLAIPCGYTNGRYGYLTDGPNTGDREYMSSFYRYTRFRAPYRKPAGDVLADKAIDTFQRFLRQDGDS